jgi:hypothetical protein
MTYWLMQALNQDLGIKLRVLTSCPQLANGE